MIRFLVVAVAALLAPMEETMQAGGGDGDAPGPRPAENGAGGAAAHTQSPF